MLHRRCKIEIVLCLIFSEYTDIGRKIIYNLFFFSLKKKKELQHLERLQEKMNEAWAPSDFSEVSS